MPDLLRNATGFFKVNFCSFSTSFFVDAAFFSKVFKVYIAKDLRLSKSFQPGICTDLNTLWCWVFLKTHLTQANATSLYKQSLYNH